MINVKRWNELKAMSKEELEKLAKELNCHADPMSILAAENRRDYPEWAKRLDEWIK